MDAAYNPIVRSFARLRTAFVAVGVSRVAVRPDAPLDELVPADRRREVWADIRRTNAHLPGLELPACLGGPLGCAGFLATIVTLWCLCNSAWAVLWWLPLPPIVYAVSRPWAVDFPRGIGTVGELAVYVTRFADHRRSGYRWTTNEIALKTRMIVADAFNLPLDAVRRDSTFRELLDG